MKKLLEQINKNHKKDADEELTKYTNKYLKKVTKILKILVIIKL